MKDITGAIPVATLKSLANPACDLETLWNLFVWRKYGYDLIRKEGIVWLPESDAFSGKW